MKKFLALILATLMLLSCTAFADNMSVSVGKDDIAKFEGTTNTAKSQKTDIWLQVEASGQIDVTVPLVLVFKTNIDGGSATTPNTYKITNNSTADLVVTKIDTAVTLKSDTNPMTIVAYTATPAEDEYKAQLSVGADVDAPSTENGKFDLSVASYSASALQGGLFEIKKATPAGVGVVTPIAVDMATGKLSFVTTHESEGVLDTDKGVHLMSVTYTVAIDTSDAVGADIKGNSVANGWSYETTTQAEATTNG